MGPCAAWALISWSWLHISLALTLETCTGKEACASQADDAPEALGTSMMSVRHYSDATRDSTHQGGGASMMSLPHNQSSAAMQQSLDDIRVLLMITTHLPPQHVEFLRMCWPRLLENSVLLQHADVLLFTAEEPPEDIIQDVFRGKQLRVERYLNPGYQSGAMLAMEVATNQSWFNGYDWMIRVNPDVLILEDEWLIKNMLDPEVDGIFADCYDGTCVRQCTEALANSDFFAVRPKNYLFPGSIPPYESFRNAERQTTAIFKNLVQQGRDRWLPGTEQHGCCRVRGNGVPVLHSHSVVHQCPLAKGQPINRNVRIGWLQTWTEAVFRKLGLELWSSAVFRKLGLLDICY